MSFHCRDCSLKQKGAFPNGKCPACGSYNITSGKGEKKRDADTGKKTGRLVVLALLWGALFFLLFQKLTTNS